MKHLLRLYLVPTLLATLSALVLIYFLFPKDLVFRAILLAFIPMLILGIGFQIITQQRIEKFRTQLYQILETLEEFDVDEPQPVQFEKSSFTIFNELNEHLIEFINRIRENYQANKQFTQNASHELQTPLAVIKGQVETLLQSPNIGEKEIESLASVLQNTNRLSKLNSALILLSKIEHQRFSDTKIICFNEVFDEVLHNFKDIINIREIKIEKSYVDTFSIEMSETLAEILIANLIQNAIRYNTESKIHIHISNKEVIISNPGKALTVNPQVLFKRFQREATLEESLGLGLSIVKRICDQSALEISYIFEKGMHSLRVSK